MSVKWKAIENPSSTVPTGRVLVERFYNTKFREKDYYARLLQTEIEGWYAELYNYSDYSDYSTILTVGDEITGFDTRKDALLCLGIVMQETM